MKRRQLLAALGAGAAAAAIARPAIAQSMPELKWRLSSSFPKSVDALYGAGETLARFAAEATDNKFQIQNFAAGEIVPGLQVADAVASDAVEMCHTAPYYFAGKDPTFAVFCSLPFGLNSRQQNAWFYDAGGSSLVNTFLKKFNIYGLPGGNTGAQMGGWFRKEINVVDDFKGLKFRLGGWAGKTIQKLGGVPQQIAGGDIYPALEKGAIDGAEWVGPYDDEKLGFHKVARFYYYPGWWEGSTANFFFINLQRWHELPKSYQAILTAASAYASAGVQARYDSRNPAALKRLLASGTQLRPFSQQILEACFRASNEVNAEATTEYPDFKPMYEHLMAFRNDEYLWWQVAEYTFDTFMIRARALRS